MRYCKQTRLSKRNRTSAKSKSGNTHSPLNWKYGCDTFWPCHFIKHKVSYLFAGGEEGAFVCCCSMLFFFHRGETKPASYSPRAACCQETASPPGAHLEPPPPHKANGEGGGSTGNSALKGNFAGKNFGAHFRVEGENNSFFI